MIKLERRNPPENLNQEFIETKKTEFITYGKSVWNISWLKDSLLDLSYSKCAYCECYLMEESKFMEVDHFENKDKYPDRVMDWDNLLPSCKRCNGNKNDHDVLIDPIINPFIDNPSTHLSLKFYRFNYKDSKGRNTIEALGLNDTEMITNKRYEVGTRLLETMEIAIERLEQFEKNKTILRKNKLLGTVKGILKECQKNSNYSATCSTVLHSSQGYLDLRDRMLFNEIWDDELVELHDNSIILVL